MTWSPSSEGMSIVIPTYNERENVPELLSEIRALQTRLGRPLELVLVDDNSPDGTAAAAGQLGKELGMDLRILTRNGRRSLGSAVADGLRQCQWDLVCVMDADLSHPASLVPALLEALDGVDGVVASRYAAGGRIASWPLSRRLVSLVATGLARRLLRLPYRDPLSGFFLVRRASLDGVEISGDGNKPLLEILVSAHPVVKEIPYEFRNRKNGESKLDGQSVVDFVRLLGRLRRVAAQRSSSRSLTRGRHPADRDG
jgi:dolichol-phosphate mannosyltransferase